MHLVVDHERHPGPSRQERKPHLASVGVSRDGERRLAGGNSLVRVRIVHEDDARRVVRQVRERPIDAVSIGPVGSEPHERQSLALQLERAVPSLEDVYSHSLEVRAQSTSDVGLRVLPAPIAHAPVVVPEHGVDGDRGVDDRSKEVLDPSDRASRSFSGL